MHILINISEKVYKSTLAYKGLTTDGTVSAEFTRYIANGKPLPKGHGRLIDADVLVDGFEDNFEFCEVVNATPTVIDADPCDNDCEHCDWVTCPKMEKKEQEPVDSDFEATIQSLEQLKSEIEWDYSPEYQISLETAIKVLKRSKHG